MSKAEAMPSLRCPVCLDQYNSSSRAPLALLCGHVTCAQCTSQLLQKHAILECPECKLLTHSVPSKCVPLIDALRCLNVLATDDVPHPEHNPWASPPNNDYELDKCILHHSVQLLLDEKEDMQASLRRFSGDENKLFHLKCEHRISSKSSTLPSTYCAPQPPNTSTSGTTLPSSYCVLNMPSLDPARLSHARDCRCDCVNATYSSTCLHAPMRTTIPGLRTASTKRFEKPLTPTTTTRTRKTRHFDDRPHRRQYNNVRFRRLPPQPPHWLRPLRRASTLPRLPL